MACCCDCCWQDLGAIYRKILHGTGRHRTDRGWRHLDLAVIVRTDAARTRLQASGIQATILTVSEAKGLEFRFVVLCDLIRDCPAADPEGVWQIPGTDVAANALGTAGDEAIRRKYAMAEAIGELKCVYCAVTRARHSCAWIETASEARIGPIRDYMAPAMVAGQSHPDAATYPVFVDRQMECEVSFVAHNAACYVASAKTLGMRDLVRMGASELACHFIFEVLISIHAKYAPFFMVQCTLLCEI